MGATILAAVLFNKVNWIFKFIKNLPRFQSNVHVIEMKMINYANQIS